MKILITGATGKVGRHFIQSVLKDPRFDQTTLRAFFRNLKMVTHVLYLATTKETPDTIIRCSQRIILAAGGLPGKRYFYAVYHGRG